MAADGQAGAAEISHQALFVAHARQRRSGAGFDDSFQQRPGAAPGALHLPESVAAVK
jgi:hypothetical protein